MTTTARTDQPRPTRRTTRPAPRPTTAPVRRPGPAPAPRRAVHPSETLRDAIHDGAAPAQETETATLAGAQDRMLAEGILHLLVSPERAGAPWPEWPDAA